MFTFTLLLCLIIFNITSDVEGNVGDNRPIVKTELGGIVGHYKKSYDGRRFSAFEGIPYVQPPIGHLRFQEPRPIGPWIGNWVADQMYTCIQADSSKAVVGDEDCLYINVYVPRLHPSPEDNLDVVVHVHGGGFTGGAAELAGPEFLMDRDIVFVNFNYRLGVLGFLSTEDKVIKGNMGMKDQVLALKWIQNHIKQFGGNPLSVTLTGLSAGAAAAHLHYFSPKSRGLFHRGISQSGTATAPWLIQKAALRYTKQLASVLGCDSSSTQHIADCLRQRSANSIIVATQKLSVEPEGSFTPISPVIEKVSDSSFLTDYPFRLLQNGKISDVPWLTSMTTEEGIIGVLSTMQMFDYIEKNWTTMAPLILVYNNTCPEAAKKAVGEKIKKFYFDNDSISNSSIPKFIRMFGDRHFCLSFEQSARMQAKVNKAPVYTYVYGYTEESINVDKLLGLDKNYGVDHATDGHLLYNMQFLGVKMSSLNLTKSDEIIKNFFVDTVVSFAKTGKPVIKGIDWQQTKDLKEFAYLFIKGPGNISMTHQREVAPKEFWKSLSLNEDELYEI